MLRSFPVFRFLGLLSVIILSAVRCSSQAASWPTYGGDAGGSRYSEARQITPQNVESLKTAWTFHTGALSAGKVGTKNSSFEATPILFHGLLYFDSPWDVIFALDPVTGEQRWKYDPQFPGVPAGLLTSRGVAAWEDSKARKGSCSTRIFVATMDARLIAVDATNGRPCGGFGRNGVVNLKIGMNVHPDEEYFISSPPTVVGDRVIVGSGISDNNRVDSASGSVKAYDARSGNLIWVWDPIPWAQHRKLPTGSANTWSVMSADLEHGIVYVPTGSPSPDYYGGLRPGDNKDANSVVALDAATGRRIWGFQVVHHDLWDYDVAAEPVLFTWRGKTPAIVIATKMGLLFVLNRLTGEPLFPVEERPVPKSDVPGEDASATQPFQRIASVGPLLLPTGMVSDTPQHSAECKAKFAKLRYEGMYTPPSFQGSINYPSNVGGVNWGGVAVDQTTGLLYANADRTVMSLQTVERGPTFRDRLTPWVVRPKKMAAQGGAVVFFLTALLFWVRGNAQKGLTISVLVSFAAALVVFALVRAGNSYLRRTAVTNVAHFGYELSEQANAPYRNRHDQVDLGEGILCSPTPWSEVSAVNLNTGEAAWHSPLGATGNHTGTLSVGGDIVTASGLVFTGASKQPLFRAFDARTGNELWDASIPAPAQSTPMTYQIRGRQYVVVAAGGHGLFGTPLSDSLVAFALP